MGAKQLLLIALGTIIVGLAIYTGVKIGSTYDEQMQIDNMVQMVTNITQDAELYYKTPTELGGGNGDFRGWVPPEALTKIDGFGEINSKQTKIRKNRISIYLDSYLKDSQGKKMRVLALLRRQKKNRSIEIKLYNSSRKKWETIHKENR